jgi:serine/threonine protein kinase/tetratricopeptide (TPR) repeat protein/TolB-like protein
VGLAEMDFELPEVLTAWVATPNGLARKGTRGIASELLRVFAWLCCRIYPSKTRKMQAAGAIEVSAGEPSAEIGLHDVSTEDSAEETLTGLLPRRSVGVRRQESHMPEEGRRFGRYQIAETLGAGGMGDVYRARDLQLGRDVAVKFLPDRFALDPARLARFDREARAASSLNHPNIVTVHEVGELDGVPYIVMERVDGRTLRELLTDRPMALPIVLDIASQIADGLAKAHGAGIVHRDLKPDNLMVNADGYVKILDFGLAKVSPDSSDGLESSASTTTGTDPVVHDPDTKAGGILGTVGYMSPEQAAGRGADFRSDQFSLGVILYEMLAGRRAFQRASHPQTLAAIIESEPEPVEKYNPGVPAPVRWILGRCLAKRPEDRYAATLDLARELQVVREHLSERLQITSTSWALSPRFRGRKLGIALGAAAVVAVGVVFLSRSLPPRTPARAFDARMPVVAILPLANLSPDPSLDHLSVGIADLLITRLASLPGLTVVSRSASLHYQGQATGKIAADLGAALLVNGAVHQSGRGKLLVTINLVRPDDSEAWGGEYETNGEDLSALVGRLAEGLSGALEVTLTAADRERLVRPPTTDRNALTDYSRARAFLERPDVPGNVDRAIDGFSAAIQKDPRFALAHAGLGDAYWAKYRESKDESWPPKAKGSITEALRLDPEQEQVRMALAEMYQATGQVDSAIEELGRAVALRPKDDQPHLALAAILAEQGRFDDSIREARTSIDLRPSYGQNHAALGYAYYRKGDYTNAISAYRRATELQPDNPRVFQMLGAAYQADGDVDKALENYRRALTIRPDSRSYSNIGSLQSMQGRFGEAARAFEEAVKLEPGSLVAHRSLGDAYQRSGEPAKAREAYLQAVKLGESMLHVNPRDGQTMAQLAVCEAKLGRRTQAARHITEALRLSPNDAPVLYRDAVIHTYFGEQAEAVASLKAALSRGYSVAMARRDNDLVPLRNLSEYRALVADRH